MAGDEEGNSTAKILVARDAVGGADLTLTSLRALTK